MIFDRLPDELRAALGVARDPEFSAVERAEMLIEVAMGLQQRPKTPDHLFAAVSLYDEALALCPEDDRLFAARIAGLIARGLSNRGIADELVISPATAARHVANIFSKLGFTSRAQVAAWAVQRESGGPA